MRDMGMEKTGLVPLSGLMRVNVQRRCLHEGKQQGQVHYDGGEVTHRRLNDTARLCHPSLGGVMVFGHWRFRGGN